MQRKQVLYPLLLACLLWLAGCSTLPTDSQEEALRAQSAKSDLLLEQRKQELAQVEKWSFNARFSLVTESEAWSGKLDWFQLSNNEYLLHFSDPAGQGAMQLLGNELEVELRLASGDSYRAEDADKLLKQETNWELPINSLWYWVRALPDPGLPLKSTELNPQNLPANFEQEHWKIHYQSYHQVDQRSFPRKITVEKDAFKLKLIIMDWMIE